MSGVQKPMDAFDRICRAPFRSVGILLRLQVGLKDRLKHKHRRCLCHPVPYAGNAQWPELAGLLLRDKNLTHRFRCVVSLPKILRQFPEPLLRKRYEDHTLISG